MKYDSDFARVHDLVVARRFAVTPWVSTALAKPGSGATGAIPPPPLHLTAVSRQNAFCPIDPRFKEPFGQGLSCPRGQWCWCTLLTPLPSGFALYFILNALLKLDHNKTILKEKSFYNN